MSEISVAPGKIERDATPKDLVSSGNLRKGVKVSKDSHRIRKRKQVRQCRPPVIIYTHPPEVIHIQPQSFMSLVQKLTGRSANATTHPGSSSVMVTDPFCIKQSDSPRSPLESSFEFDSLFSPQLSDPRSRTYNPQMTPFSSTSSSNLFIQHRPGSVLQGAPTSKPQMLSHQRQDFIQSPVPMVLSPQGWSQSNCHGGDAKSAPPGSQFTGYNPSLEDTGTMVSLEKIHSFTLT